MAFIKVIGTLCDAQGRIIAQVKNPFHLNTDQIAAIAPGRVVSLTSGKTVIFLAGDHYTNLILDETVKIDEL